MFRLRKLAGTALLLALLVCTMGASTISFDAGQPVPNPGGVASLVTATGTFVEAANEKCLTAAFHAKEVNTNQQAFKQANFNIPMKKWDGDLNLVAGSYDFWALMAYGDQNGNVQFAKSAVVNKKVK
jgi:hypothetical protein